jgi:predicted PurR-regulated permease PerM
MGDNPVDGDRGTDGTADGTGAVRPAASSDRAPARGPATAVSPAAGSLVGATAVVPEWLANLAALGWRVVAIAGLVVVLWLLSALLWTVTASIAVAIVISAVFAPAVLRLRAGGRSETAAAGIVWAAACVGLVLVLVLLGIAFLPYIGEVLQSIDAGVANIESQITALQLPAAVGAVLGVAVTVVRGFLTTAASDIVGSAASIVTVLVLSSFLVFFFLRDGDKAWRWIFQAVDDEKRHRITEAGSDALARVGGYLRGTTVLSAIIAGTDLVFMLLLGVPLAVPLAALVFLSGYIPYFGGIVTTAIILVVTYSTLGTGPALILLVLIGIRNVFLGYGIRPVVYGRTVSIHPALVLIALPAGFQLAGIVGLFAAVPVTAVVLAVASATVAILQPDPVPELPGMVPAWLDRVAQWSWRLLVGIALIAMLVAIFVSVPLVLIPIALALILAATLEPVVAALIRRGRSRGQAAALSVGGGFLAILGILVLAVVALVEQAGAMMQGAGDGATKVNEATGGQLGLLAGTVATLGRGGLSAIAEVAQGLASIAVIMVLGAMLAFYFLRDGGALWTRILGVARPAARPELHAAGVRAFDVMGGYMGGTAAISFVGSASQLVIMVILGIPFALPVFVLSFFLCFIPYIGGFISTGLALLLAVAFGTPFSVAVMIVWTLVFNIVTGNIVSPLVYGRTVHIHPGVVLVAIPAGSAIAGILGMFFVVPVIGVVATTWRTVLRLMGEAADMDAAGPPAEPALPIPAAGDVPDAVAPSGT